MKSAQIGKYIYSTRAIGKGSFSKVYKGFDTRNDEIIAIKIIDKHTLKKDLVKRLQEEINLTCQLNHRHIASLKNFLTDQDSFYLVLEYCSGGDLAHYIKQQGRIPEKNACRYMRQLADALQYLKFKNIIHRDLKPHNILLSGDHQEIKLTDFNFAREMYDTDLAQTLCGSPLYMAPEIIKRREYTIKADIWSVGLVLYEMVYGVSPYFDCTDILDLINKIDTRPIRYSDIVSSQCNLLLKDLLQNDPHLRLSWTEFFNHAWLNKFSHIPLSSTPINITKKLSTVPDHTVSMYQLTNIPSITPNFEIDVLDNYVPFGVTPPKHTHSEPTNMYRINSIERSRSNSNSNSGINPNTESKTIVDNLWSALKGAVSYISSK